VEKTTRKPRAVLHTGHNLY